MLVSEKEEGTSYEPVWKEIKEIHEASAVLKFIAVAIYSREQLFSQLASEKRN